jgi:Lrp/AsnC family transcriptional regulator, leucine-responsive regulatory protein
MPRQDGLSRIDLRILDILQRDGRASFADIGAAVGMSAPSAHERVKKLEARGVIQGYGARLDARALGRGILAFSWVRQSPGPSSTELTAAFGELPEIEECHHIAGEADYLLKVRAADTLDLERVMKRIQAIPFVYTTETDVVYSSAFEHRPLAIPNETAAEQEA